MLRPDQIITSELYQQQLIRVNDALEEERPDSRRMILLQGSITPGLTKQKRFWKPLHT